MKRKKKAFINIITGVISQILISVLALFTTRVIKQSLGFEYMGLNGVFSNIISFLNMSELGIGAIVVYFLYKPLAEDNQEEILSILLFLKKAYYSIAAFIFFGGLCVIPFLNKIITTTLPTYYVILVYLIFLISSSSSYILTYKFLVVTADQKKYILTLYRLAFTYIIKILQLVVFLITKSYILYLLINLFFSILKNIIINIKVNKLYPYLRTKAKSPLPKEKKKILTDKIKAMSLHVFASYILSGTDNLLISILISIVSAGKYAGYCSINSLLLKLTNQIFENVTPSIGNYLNTETKEAQLSLFNKFNSITRLFYMFVPVCFTILIEPFITWWLGADTLLPHATAICLGLLCFFTIVRKPIIGFKNSAGLMEPDRYAPLIEGGINLISSIIFGKLFGLPGILMGTILSFLCIPLWLQPKIVFNYLFDKSVIPYILNLIKDFFITVIIYLIIFYVQKLIKIENNFSNLIVKAIVSVSLNGLLVYLVNIKFINATIKKIIDKKKLK